MKQRHLFLLALALAFTLQSGYYQSEYFEGYIHYETRFFDLSGKMDITHMMKDLHDTEQHYYIKIG